ncbi:hypothetical protein [Roseovarius sp. THAF9]|uniref:hypothetical protein n=1 Tax=Roseovarius sp. THAF9 TaxID=2587847 RepID=UPI0020C820C3|nr:hypothetical protein [Roseovarius sp. THAF9]
MAHRIRAAVRGNNQGADGPRADQVCFAKLAATNQRNRARMLNNHDEFPELTTILETRHILASK